MTSPGGCLKSAKQKAAFRVDASNEIGTGHFVRCLTLADALKERGAQIRFVSRQMPVYLRDMLATKGHEFISLNSSPSEVISGGLSHANWLGTSQHADAQDTAQALSDKSWDWLVVDHYALDTRWESVLRQATKNILVIDDIADRKHNCDLLLDQNFFTDLHTRYSGKVPSHCQLLLGPRYALLREEFRHMREQVKPRTGPVKRVMIFFGGIDADNYTSRAIEALSNLGILDLHVDVVIGSQHPCREQIESECVQHGFICHVQTDRMAELMASADLAMGAGGSASWERCCLGLPTLSVSLAGNQFGIAESQDHAGACIFLGNQVAATQENMQKALLELLTDPNRLTEMSEKAFSLLDGFGVERVSELVICSK
jgi:UDP-2,4-diacetamido-2,4,6-trideoxy-beta-L-altropyranose hydrolase